MDRAPAALPPESETARLSRVASNCERINAAPRLTIGALNDMARRVRADLETLTHEHQQPACREDVTGVLGEMCVALGTYDGCPAVYMQPMGDSELAQELMMLGTMLRTRLPRKWTAILAATRLDRAKCVVWWKLPPEPADETPYEAAA